MSGPQTLMHDDDIDVAGLFSKIWEKKVLVGLITLATFLCMMLALSMISPRYKSSSRMLIENRETVFTRSAEETGERLAERYDEQAIGSQVEVINSDELALKVIEGLELATRSEFIDSSLPTFVNEFLLITGLKSTLPGANDDERALRSFRKRLNVYAVEKSRVIVIEFWSSDPKLAQLVPNTLAETYLSQQKSTRRSSTNEATNWLGPEVETMRERLREAEAKVAEFRANSDILVGDNNALLATQQLSEVSTELSRLRAERSSAEAKVASIRAALKNGSSIDVIPEVIASPLVQRLRERQVAMKVQISDLSTSLLPSHPRLKSLNSQVNDFEVQIRSAAKNILISLENNVDLTRKTEADLRKEVNRLKSEAARVGEAEVGLRALEREAAAERELLQIYSRRFREAASRQSEQFFPVDARVISKATLPVESYFPKVLPFSIVGSIAAFALTIIGILFASLMAGPARALSTGDFTGHEPEMVTIQPGETNINLSVPLPEEIIFETGPASPEQENFPKPERESVLPQLPDAPELDAEPRQINPIREVADNTQSATLAVRYAASVLADMGSCRIVVTSPGGDAGSRVTWMLARSLARAGKRVALVDLSGGGVTSLEMLGSKDLPGIFDLMTGNVAFDRIAYRDRTTQAHVVPTGTMASSATPPDMEELVQVLDAIAQAYDFCIVDSGDTGADGISMIAESSNIIVISGIGADQEDCTRLEGALQAMGYHDVLQIVPDSIDAEKEALTAA